MSLKYFISPFLVLITLVSWGQDSKTQVFQVYKVEKPRVVSMNLGWLEPFALGNNFANKGLNVSRGFDFQVNLFLQDTDVYLGYRFQNLSAKTTDVSLVGLYATSSISLHAATIGYNFNIQEKFAFRPSVSVGLTRYNNRTSGRRETFKDTGTTGILSGAFDYKLNKTIYIYFAPECRVDFMNIETADEVASFFKRAIYLNINAGFTFNF